MTTPVPNYSKGERGLTGTSDSWFFADRDAGTPIPVGPAWVRLPMIDQYGDGFLTAGVMFKADAGTFQFSWDGATVSGRLTAVESVTFDVRHTRDIYVRGVGGAAQARIWAW